MTRESDTPAAYPVACFISFRCYGTWLHGDPRGSVNRLHNQFGEPLIEPDERRQALERSRQWDLPFRLAPAARIAVEQAVVEVCEHRGWTMHAIAVRTNHLHVIVSAAYPPEPVMTSFKSWATRRLVRDGLAARGASVWSRHGSTRYLWDDVALASALRYVLEGQ